jgi:hypothetical protein
MTANMKNRKSIIDPTLANEGIEYTRVLNSSNSHLENCTR